MNEMALGFPEMLPNRKGEVRLFVAYLEREAERICLHLDKLDRLPLDERFDFRLYFDNKEFVYVVWPSHSLGQVP